MHVLKSKHKTSQIYVRFDLTLDRFTTSKTISSQPPPPRQQHQHSTPTGRIPVPVFQADLWKSVSYSSTNLTWNMNKKVKVYYDSLNHEVVIRYNAIDSRLNKCNHIKEVLNMICLILLIDFICSYPNWNVLYN